MPYEVSTPVFEGPFDLLLHLITRQQVDLYDVSLSAIVDGYLTQLGEMSDLDLEVATEFLLIAATLIELKSSRLLPGAAGADVDDELSLWEERDLLLARLVECKTFKDAARALERLAAAADRSRPRLAGMEERFLTLAPDVLAGVGPQDLKAALVRALAPKPPPPRVDLTHVALIKASVKDAVEDLAAVLPATGPTTFRRLTSGIEERIEVVVRFLALLELYKDGLVELEQASAFGEMVVTWLGPAATAVTGAAAAPARPGGAW